MSKKCTRLWSYAQYFEVTAGSKHFCKLMLKKCMPLWREAHFESFRSQHAKHTVLGALLKVQLLKRRMLLWCEAHLDVKSVKKLTVSEHFLRWGRCSFAWQAQWVLQPCEK